MIHYIDTDCLCQRLFTFFDKNCKSPFGRTQAPISQKAVATHVAVWYTGNNERERACRSEADFPRMPSVVALSSAADSLCCAAYTKHHNNTREGDDNCDDTIQKYIHATDRGDGDDDRTDDNNGDDSDDAAHRCHDDCGDNEDDEDNDDHKDDAKDNGAHGFRAGKTGGAGYDLRALSR